MRCATTTGWLAKRLHGGRALAVLKADAYGHGAIACAQAPAGLADGHAVAFLEEAPVLRQAGITEPIPVQESVFEADELDQAGAHGLWTVVHQESPLRMLETGRHHHLNLWLKIDSGMHRAGFALTEAASAHARLQASGKVECITLMTHFARADEPGAQATALQIAASDAATQGLAVKKPCAARVGGPGARRAPGAAGIISGLCPASISPSSKPSTTPTGHALCWPARARARRA